LTNLAMPSRPLGLEGIWRVFMEQLQQFKRAIVFQILLTAAVVSAAALLFGFLPAAKGFALGSCFSLANFLIMTHQAPKRLGKSSSRVGWESYLSLLFRFALLGLPLYLALRLPQFNFIWTALGIFNLQISIFIHGLIIERWTLTSRTNIPRR